MAITQFSRVSPLQVGAGRLGCATEPARAASRAPLLKALAVYTKRPTSMIPNRRIAKIGRTSANSTMAWPLERRFLMVSSSL